MIRSSQKTGSSATLGASEAAAEVKDKDAVTESSRALSKG